MFQMLSKSADFAGAVSGRYGIGSSTSDLLLVFLRFVLPGRDAIPDYSYYWSGIELRLLV